MPRRVVAARERTGMVRLEGYGKMDDRGTCQLAAGGKDRGRQNFRLSDAQFEHLIETIELRALPGSEAPFRAELDRIREFVLKDCLQKDQEPSRAEVHHALTVLRSRTENFLERATAIRRWPDWFVRPAPFGSSASSVFSSFPEILLDLATQARHDANISERAACDFRAFAETSEELRYELKSLDSVSQGKILDRLPQTNDYAIRTLADAIRIAQRLQRAIFAALEISKKRGGPTPRTAMLQSAIWLGDLLESYGGEFVHNPRVNDEYDGRIHTPAGWFVHRFLMLCDSRITETNAANIMAAAVKFRNRRGQHRS